MSEKQMTNMSSLIYIRSLVNTSISLNNTNNSLKKLTKGYIKKLHSSAPHNSNFVRLFRLTYTVSYHDIIDCYVLTILRDGNIKNDLQMKI